MALDLTLVSPSYADFPATGFGQALVGGTALQAGVITGLPFTIKTRVRATTASGGNMVAAGQYKAGWIGRNSANQAVAAYGTGNTFLTSDVVINDGTWYDLELEVTATEVRFYVNGVLKGTGTTGLTFDTSLRFGVRAFEVSAGGVASNPWGGQIDELSVWSTVDSSGTPAASPYTGAESGLLALYHFEGNGTNSAGAAAAATAITLTGPTSGAVSAASSAFTVGANGTISGTVVVTPSDAGAGGTFTPASVSISAGTPTATFTYTPASTGAKTISVTNDGALTNPSNITYTVAASDVTAPTLVSAVIADGARANIVLTFSETLGAFTPAASAFALSGGKTATSVARSGATVTVTADSIYAFGDAPTIAYTAPGANALQDAAGNLVASFGATAVTNNIVSGAGNAYDKTKILFSPYNWNVQNTFARTINGGAYFKTLFGGATCTLSFDMANAAAPYTKLAYRVDGTGPWIAVDLAASVPITIPTETAGYASHFLEVIVKATSLNLSRWSATSQVGVSLTGITLDAGKSLSLPTALPLRALVYGDSITEGYRSLNGTGDATANSDASQSYAFEACKRLGAEAGIVAFSSQGWDDTGSGAVPVFSSTYAALYSGVARSFTPAPDFILINHGTNDTGDVTATATTVLNALIAATPATTKIIVLRPFDGSSDADLIEAIAATTTPSRISYIDTTGWFTSANAADGLHPYGFEHIHHIAPLASAAILPLISGAETLPETTSRTVTLQLGDAGGALANLTGLKVAFYDEASPDLQTNARYQSATETTDASGNLSFNVETTLASGGIGHITVLSDSGSHYNGPVAVV